MKKFLFLLLYTFLYASVMAQSGEPRRLTGVVDDDTGEPLIGATVKVVGTNSAASTDIDGKFTISVPSGTKNGKLAVSYVGYATQTIDIAPNVNDYHITLATETAVFDELVVIGYGTAKKSALTSSVEVIKSDDLLRMTSMNIDQGLAGLVSGLGVMNTTGDPSSGTEATLSIRGNTGDPLLVIDGVPRLGTTTNDGEMRLSDLNPEDIESISVLKDAAASAVYGARAANGVILVQTKRGDTSKTRVNYRGQFNFEEATYLPKFLDSYKFAELYNRAVENSASDVYTPYDLSLIGSNPDLYGNDNMLDYLNRWGHSQRHSLSVAGGVKSVRYYISVGYTNTQGLYSNVGRDRYNYAVKLDTDLYKGLNLSVDITGSISEYKNTSSTTLDQAYEYSPLEVLRYSDGHLASLEGSNPLIAVEGLGGYEKNKTDFHTVNATLTYNLPWVEGLSAYFKGTMDMNHKNTTIFEKPVELYIYDALTGTTSPDENTVYPKAQISMTDRHMSVDNKLLELGINYNHTFNKVHDVTGLIIANYQDYKNKYLRATNNNLPGEYPEIIGTTTTATVSGSEYYSQRASLVGRATYGYDNRYFAEFSFRLDGSTRFAPENRWGFFPTVSASWVLSNEAFFKERIKPSLMSQAKLRASAGILGDDGAVSDYSYLQQYSFSYTNGYPFGGSWTQGILPSVSSYPNKNLKWGKSKDYNVGLDLGFFNNKLTASIEWYQRMRTNMVTSAETYSFPPSTGTGGVTPNVNIGKVRFRGWDFSISHMNNIGDWSYNLSFNLGTTSNIVLDWGDESSMSENLRRKGNPYMVWTMYQADGLFQSQEEIDNWPLDQDGKGNSTIAPGDIKYIDQDGDGKLTTSDLIYVKNSSYPDVSYGFSLGVAWKGIHLNAQFQGVSGYNQRITELYTLENQSLQRFQDYHYTNTWTPENPNAEYPRVKFASTGDNNRLESTYWIRNCNFLRLKTLSIGYSLPSAMLRKVKISKVDISLQAGNLFTLSSLNNMDPESLRGYPLSRSYGATLSLGF